MVWKKSSCNIVPTILEYTSNVSIRTHSNLVLTCPIVVETSQPFEIFISWTVNGIDQTMLSLDLRFEFKSNNRILKISNVRPNDAGTYKCTGVTGYGVKEAVFTVKTIEEKFCSIPTLKMIEKSHKSNQKFKPCFINPPPNSNLVANPNEIDHLQEYRYKLVRNVGDSVQFNCSAAAQPRPRYRWTKDSSSVDWINEISGIRGPVLTIRKLRIEYSGHFTCEASNELGKITFTFTLIIRERHSETPKILNVLQNVTAKSGAHVMLVGTILCSCKPVIQWLKRVTDLSNGNNLKIPEARPSEMEEYYSVIDPALDKRITIETVMKDNGVLLSILRFKTVNENDSGKYILYSSRGNDGVSYRSSYLKINDQTTIHPPFSRDSRRLVLYITIPIFILVFCSAVIFYCCSRSQCTCKSSSSSSLPQTGQSGQQITKSNNSCLPSKLCSRTSESVSSCSKSVHGNSYPHSTTMGSATTCKGSNGSSVVMYQRKTPNDTNNLPYMTQNCLKNPSYVMSTDISQSGGEPHLSYTTGLGREVDELGSGSGGGGGVSRVGGVVGGGGSGSNCSEPLIHHPHNINTNSSSNNNNLPMEPLLPYNTPLQSTTGQPVPNLYQNNNNLPISVQVTNYHHQQQPHHPYYVQQYQENNNQNKLPTDFYPNIQMSSSPSNTYSY